MKANKRKCQNFTRGYVYPLASTKNPMFYIPKISLMLTYSTNYILHKEHIEF